jgi:hypothetical protein
MDEAKLSNTELLVIEQLCLEGEFRCAERASSARRKEDYPAATYETRLKHQYSELRKKLLRLNDAGDSGRACPDTPAADGGARNGGAALTPV